MIQIIEVKTSMVELLLKRTERVVLARHIAFLEKELNIAEENHASDPTLFSKCFL